MTTSPDSAIVRFYDARGPDHRGRRLDEILRWDDEALEEAHDYIQWVFPLAEPSAFNPYAPLVTAADRKAFGSDARLAANLRRSFERMLAFYGFEMNNGKVARAANWSERTGAWLRPHNHNYLRLTRIMKSVTLLGQPALAQALRDALIEEFRREPDRIGATTVGYWKAAVR